MIIDYFIDYFNSWFNSCFIMSYNGIGLTAARGSGTNGFIQKNYTKNSESSYSKRQNIKKQNESRLQKQGFSLKDPILIDHEIKRKEIDLKVSEYRDKLEEEEDDENGLNDDEITKKCNEYKEELIRLINVKKGYKPRRAREEKKEKGDESVDY